MVEERFLRDDLARRGGEEASTVSVAPIREEASVVLLGVAARSGTPTRSGGMGDSGFVWTLISSCSDGEDGRFDFEECLCFLLDFSRSTRGSASTFSFACSADAVVSVSSALSFCSSLFPAAAASLLAALSTTPKATGSSRRVVSAIGELTVAEGVGVEGAEMEAGVEDEEETEDEIEEVEEVEEEEGVRMWCADEVEGVRIC